MPALASVAGAMIAPGVFASAASAPRRAAASNASNARRGRVARASSSSSSSSSAVWVARTTTSMSSSPLGASRRVRGVVATRPRATPPEGEAAPATADACPTEPVDEEQIAMRDALAVIKRDRAKFTEIAENEKRKEQKCADRCADLEQVAQTQAQLAVKAWEDHSAAEELVVEAAAKVDAAVERYGVAELALSDARAKRAAAFAAAGVGVEGDDDGDADADDEIEKDSSNKPAAKPAAAEKDWWTAEGLSAEESVAVVAERVAEAEKAYETAREDKDDRTKFSAGIASNAQEAKELAQAADARADDAMRLVEESMEAVIAARIAAAVAEEELASLDKAEDAILNPKDFKKKEKAKKVKEEEEAAAAEASIAAEEEAEKAEKADAKKKDKKDKKDKEEEESAETVKAKAPSPTSSSKQFASKWFTSDTEKFSNLATGAGLALAVAFLAGMILPGGAKFRAALSHTGASVTSTIDKGWKSITSMIPESERKIAEHAAHEAEEAGLTDALVLLFTSIFAVTLVSKIPGGSPVLGFLLGGAMIGPYTTGLIGHVEGAKVLAEFGVVFLLFNIGLELSLERLQSMAKYIFGMGSAQMLMSTLVGATIACACGLAVPPAVVIGMGLAFSSTAVALQVLQDRGETGSRHGRATFSVLLFQDLTVVLVFMLVPLLAGPDSGSITAICGSLAKAIVKTVAAIGVIMVSGRAILRPIYRRIANLGKAEVLTATTLFVALGTSLLTQSLGLSMALGAFLAGLLLAETEFHLQVESDIAPFRGLLLGLFFMTVGMQIDPSVLMSNSFNIIVMAFGLLVGKLGVMAVCGPLFGLPLLASLRSGVYVAPGGEFAFVTFGLAASAGLLTMDVVNQINLAVVLTMALTPLLANLGSKLKDVLKQDDGVVSLQAKEGENDDLSGHVIVAGYGRVGRIIGDLLNEQLIPFVALDISADNVNAGRSNDMPVYFGDAGAETVLHAVGAAKASCAVVTLDTAESNYRVVYALQKHYPDVKVYVRAKDVANGLLLEKAGAKAVVPETLEPSLQLAAAVLGEMDMSNEDISIAVDNFRRTHIQDLKQLQQNSGGGLGYGLPTDMETLQATMDELDEGGLVDLVPKAV